MWRDPQPIWTSPAGHVVQLGDAAHTIPAGGGTLALEEAVSLATCLAMAGKDNIPTATRVHNLLNFERVSFLMAQGIGNREKRDTNKNKDMRKVKPVFGRWLYDHDPEQYAFDNYDKAMAHIEHGAGFKNTNAPPGVEYQPWTINSLTKTLEKGEPTILDGGWS